MSDHPLLDELARQLRHSASGATVLTGSGISAASGVPTFRGRGGIWDRWDPLECATIDAIRRHPARVWAFLRELDAVLTEARPNASHLALASLEQQGLVKTIITQNIDSLHQHAGSQRVIELHGSNRTLTCMACGARYTRKEAAEHLDGEIPCCLACKGVLKPDVTFFGEPLPAGAFQRADHAVRNTDLLLVIGTSAEIDPAARLPVVARHYGATIWEINPDPELDADGTIAQPAEDVLPKLVDRLAPQDLWSHLVGLVRGSVRSLRF